ncbi:MAG: acetylglutamate kinase [Chloroflexi bacterium CG_4_10_14_0_8_um_filter_46_9]|nr:MAG: acetylglutamate kinase [Dehalococcoidia bacterium CG2_30_46_19]PIZ27110.1 MAG: acetylglutamate kinase [Chloroflexi bacterium CG_4_10_14_0_8_um_filter_46_9]
MKPLVVKIGGSTLGNRDTVLKDLAALQKQGMPLVVVHGGAQEVSHWLARLGIPTSFINGLRVTDAETLKVVAAILGGLVNKELVVGIQALNGKAIGISGSDGNLLRAKLKNSELGYTGEIIATDPTPLNILLQSGYMPVVAPISFGEVNGKLTLLNVNGDTAAGEIAAALAAQKLIFLTDVDGVYDSSGKIIPRLNIDEANKMLARSTASGGMSPKIEASLKALSSTPLVRIINGKIPRALLNEMENGIGGTSIVPK